MSLPSRDDLARAILRAAHEDDRRRLDDGFEWYDSAQNMADAILRALATRTADRPSLREAALRDAILFGPDVEFPNLPTGPRITGPDVLVAVAAWMDRKDDEWETEAGGSGLRANRDVQAHLRAWSAALRQALEDQEADLRSGRSTEDEG